MKKCGNCSTCDYVQEGKVVKSTQTDAIAVINVAVTCRDTRVIYCITASPATNPGAGRNTVARLCQNSGPPCTNIGSASLALMARLGPIWRRLSGPT